MLDVTPQDQRESQQHASAFRPHTSQSPIPPIFGWSWVGKEDHVTYALVIALLVCGAEVAQTASFSDFLERVEERDPRTQAILKVNATEDSTQENNPTTWWNCEITIGDESATVKVYNNYKSGKKGDSLHFPVEDAVKREAKRLENYHHLQHLDREVAQAEIRRRIFVRSNFQLRKGDSESKILEVYGKPAQRIPLNEAGCFGLSYEKLYIIIDGHRKLMDILPPEE